MAHRPDAAMRGGKQPGDLRVAIHLANVEVF